MADKPILFSAAMIRALLAGTKTQTRRILKPQPHGDVIRFGWDRHEQGASWTDQKFESGRLPCWAGDRLWVREAWRAQEAFDRLSPLEIMAEFSDAHGDPSFPVFYEADQRCDGSAVETWQQSRPGRIRASMHMPRCTSRLTLHVEDVKVERLQDISEEDALAEGIDRLIYPETGEWGWPQRRYRDVWNAINGPDAWEANPWVVAIVFRVERANIDAARSPEGGT